jgi:hypothetical protein
MTNAELFVRVLSEATGQPKERIASLLADFRKAHPAPKFDEEADPITAEGVLKEAREHPEGILSWLKKGYLEVMQNLGHA